MANRDSLVQANVHFMQQGIDLLKDINDTLYVNTESPHFNSGVGKHMRHILDHYLSFVQHSGHKVDYDDRERDERIETNRQYAVQTARNIIDKFLSLDAPGFIERTVLVKSNEGAEGQHSPWSKSSIKRELQFLLSHTVHHYALIALILKIQGYDTHEEFGVAPSTLKYHKEETANKAG